MLSSSKYETTDSNEGTAPSAAIAYVAFPRPGEANMFQSGLQAMAECSTSEYRRRQGANFNVHRRSITAAEVPEPEPAMVGPWTSILLDSKAHYSRVLSVHGR